MKPSTNNPNGGYVNDDHIKHPYTPVLKRFRDENHNFSIQAVVWPFEEKLVLDRFPNLRISLEGPEGHSHLAWFNIQLRPLPANRTSMLIINPDPIVAAIATLIGPNRTLNKSKVTKEVSALLEMHGHPHRGENACLLSARSALKLRIRTAYGTFSIYDRVIQSPSEHKLNCITGKASFGDVKGFFTLAPHHALVYTFDENDEPRLHMEEPLREVHSFKMLAEEYWPFLRGLNFKVQMFDEIVTSRQEALRLALHNLSKPVAPVGNFGEIEPRERMCVRGMPSRMWVGATAPNIIATFLSSAAMAETANRFLEKMVQYEKSNTAEFEVEMFKDGHYRIYNDKTSTVPFFSFYCENQPE